MDILIGMLILVVKRNRDKEKLEVACMYDVSVRILLVNMQ
jgi:hypothetical protein